MFWGFSLGLWLQSLGTLWWSECRFTVCHRVPRVLCVCAAGMATSAWGEWVVIRRGVPLLASSLPPPRPRRLPKGVQ